MRRVLLHLGFHKTGTTAAQSFLFQNRELIWPQHALVLPYRTRPIGLSEAATRYSVLGTPTALATFDSQLRHFLSDLDFGRKRGLILSEENFAGLRPSRNAAIGYAATPDLAQVLVNAVIDRFIDEELDITVYLSLRQKDDWLRSLWAHDLQRTRLVLGFDDFADHLSGLGSLRDAAEDIREGLEGADVHVEWLERMQDLPFGSGTPFLEFLQFDSAKTTLLRGPKRSNTSVAPDVLNALLDLNRSMLDEAELTEQKAALIEAAQADAKS